MSEYVVLVLTVLYVLCLWPIVPQIVSKATLVEVVVAMLPLLILAVGQSFVLIVAGIDLSMTSVVALASVIAASVMTGDGGLLAGSAAAVPVGLAGFLIVGLVAGLFNGLCITRFGMPALMVTLVGQTLLAGCAVWYTSLRTDSVSIAALPAAFNLIGRGSIAGIPYALLICGAVVLSAGWILQKTTLGRWLYAVGANPRAARVSGVPVERVIVVAFVLSGLCAALASIIYTARLETGSPVLGQRVLLDVIGAAVIGGVSLFGGKGKVAWVILGVLFLTVVDKGLQLLGMSQFLVFAVKGGVILLAAILDALRNRLLVGGSK